MAKGKFTALQMYDKETKNSDTIDKKMALKLMRKFMMQEILWWDAHCKKWEKAYEQLMKETEI